MILQALRQLALDENLVGDPDFEYKPVSWRINLAADGSLVNIEDLRRNLNEGKKAKPRYEGKPVLVPRQQIRTSADSSFFFVDKSEYILGIDPEGKRPASKLAARAALFREQIEICADNTQDPAVRAVLRFLQSIAESHGCLGPQFDVSQVAANELFAFRVGLDESFVHSRPAVVRHWKGRRSQSQPAGATFRCLITGEPMAEVGLFPQIKKVPGGTPSGVALVSHNARAFESYGLRGNENAPISRTAAEQAGTALNRLLHPAYPNPADPASVLRQRFVRLSADTVVCFWTAGHTSSGGGFLDALPDLLEGEDEATVGETYRSVWSGREITINDPSAFYALVLSGTQGRAIVRDWFETTLAEVAANLAQHFRDLAIVRHARPKKGNPETPTVPLRWLMQSLAAQGESDPVPASLEAALIRAAFLGMNYPFQLLQRALVRARAEAGRAEWTDAARRDARASLLKAVLNRKRRNDPHAAERYPEVQRSMNPHNDNPGYNLGMLMAVLERLQGAALGDVNASLVDRYFSAASATPRTVFVRLLKNSRHHVRKGSDSDNRADRVLSFRCDRLIDAIADRFHVDRKHYPPRASGLPGHLGLEEQGLFVLGYHQMRHWLWLTKQDRVEWEREYPDAPPAFRWSREPAEKPEEPETVVE